MTLQYRTMKIRLAVHELNRNACPSIFLESQTRLQEKAVVKNHSEVIIMILVLLNIMLTREIVKYGIQNFYDERNNRMNKLYHEICLYYVNVS